MELYADTTGCTVVAPPEDTDAVLLGTAMVAAASGRHKDLGAAASAMARPGTTHRPDSARHEAYDWRYRAFLEMQEQRRALDRLLDAGA